MYEPIPADRIHAYSAAAPPPGCGTRGTRGTTPYRQVAGNAFYCPAGDFVAYDVQQLVPALREKHGAVAVALVLAHEWGHAIQARVGAPDDVFVYTELQADCFAGAWARRVVRGDGTDLRMSEDDLDRALAGFIDLHDPSGVDGSARGAHGNAFDRVGAFQDGLLGDTVIYCAESRTIVYASSTLQQAADRIGDLGAGVFVAAARGSAVHSDLGSPLGTNRARAASECLTGAWAGAIERGTASSRGASFAFSPGDLDEVVVAFVATNGARSTVDRGSVFDRVNLFRTGFDRGPAACLTT